MIQSELRLTALKHLLFRIDLYGQLIEDKGYKNLSTRRYRQRFHGLRNSIEFEIGQIQESLKDKDIETLREDFSFGEVSSYLKSETDIESLIAELDRVSMEISKESERLGVAIIGNFDVLPEWIFQHLQLAHRAI